MSNQAPGTIGNYQLSLTAQFKNTNPSETITPTLYVVVVYEGTFNVNDGACSHMLGVLSPSDVLNAQPMPIGSYSKSEDVYGGSFFSTLKGLFSKANRVLRDTKVISKGLAEIPNPYAQVGSKVAHALGYGVSGGSLTGGNLSALCEVDDSDDDY